MNDVEKYYWEQDDFHAQMIDAYKQHKIPQWFAFHSYFDWKMGKRKCDFTSGEIASMRNTALRLIDKLDDLHPNAWENINPENPYSGYKEDADVVKYLTQISEELVNIQILRMV